MTSRRQFLQGAVAVAVAATLPSGDGVALYSAAHPRLDQATELHRAFMLSMMETEKMVFSNLYYNGVWAVRTTLEDGELKLTPITHKEAYCG